MTLLRLVNLRKDYVNEELATPVLHDISLAISSGEFVAIMGPSGSGKSTLMHILGFLDRPTAGVYEFAGEDTNGFDDSRLASLRNRSVGFVFQAFNLLPRTTVLENVALPLVYSQNPNEENAAHEALVAVGLTHREQYLTSQISGGEQQRVAIARALVNDPSVIFADEPTGNLDSQSGNIVMSILARLHAEGRTIILVTHETYTASYAERVIKLKDGRIESDEKVLNRPQTYDFKK